MSKTPATVSSKAVFHSPSLFSLVVLMIAISAVSLMLYDRMRYQPIMTIDVEKIMQQKLSQLQNQNTSIPQDEMIRLSNQWAQQLSHEVTELSKKYNAIVLARPAVVEGSIDMTQQIMNKLAEVAQ